MAEALFETDGDGWWRPTEAARGPWSPHSLHGGPVAALLAREAQAAATPAAVAPMQPARLTVELLRPVPLSRLSVRAEVIRAGRKVQWIDAEMLDADGQRLAAARLLRIRIDHVEVPEQPAASRPWPPAEGRPAAGSLVATSYSGFHDEGVEHRFVAGQLGEVGPATDWIRLRVPVVAGEEPSPLERVVAAADFGNGIAAAAPFWELRFINADLTVHLHRQAVGEWVCLDAVTWLGTDGVAMAESALYDEQGPIGRSVQSLILER